MDRLWLFITSKEGLALISSELKALCETYSMKDFDFKKLSKNLFLVKGSINAQRVAERSAFVRGYGLVFATLKNNMYEEVMDVKEELSKIETFAIKLDEDCKEKEYLIDLGWSKIKEKYKNAKVNLENPQHLVHIIFNNNEVYFALGKAIGKKGWMNRRPRRRPFFHPSGLYPKLARILVNLSRVKEDETLIDPFCGTGSILIEASFVGINAIGMDINLKMCYGCKRNLKFFTLPINLIRGDAKYLPFSYIDGVATDAPYGRCASTYGMDPSELITSFLNSLKNIMKRGRYCIILHSRAIDFEYNGFSLLEQHDLYVHRNLIRRISVLKRD